MRLRLVQGDPGCTGQRVLDIRRHIGETFAPELATNS